MFSLLENLKKYYSASDKRCRTKSWLTSKKTEKNFNPPSQNVNKVQQLKKSLFLFCGKIEAVLREEMSEGKAEKRKSMSSFIDLKKLSVYILCVLEKIDKNQTKKNQ